MAKKAVATFSSQRGGMKKMVMCIKMVRSETTGSYGFQEEMVPAEESGEFFK